MADESSTDKQTSTAPPLVVEVSKDFERQFLNTAGGFNAPILIKRVNPNSHQEEVIHTTPAQLIEALSGYMINLAMTLATVNQNLVQIGQHIEELTNGLAATLEAANNLTQVIEQNTEVGEAQLEEDDAEEQQPMFEAPPRRAPRPRKRT